MATLVACGGNSGAVNTDTGLSSAESLQALTTATIETRQKLLSHMQDRYLWYQSLPELDLNNDQYADLRILLDDLRKTPEDRFSVLVNPATQQQRIDQGVTGSYGLRFYLRENTDPDTPELIDVRIAGVEDFGSVALAGIQRGDRVIGAQGKTIDELGFDGFREIFAEPGLGVERVLDIRHPDGTEQSYTIRRTAHNLNPVRKQTIFTHPDTGRRVGYVLIEEFIRLTSEQLVQFRQDYGNMALDDIIIDLRYNGGGLVSASRDLASSIYGQSQRGDVYTVLQRNDQHTNEDSTFHFQQFDTAFQSLERVFILTTESTCSASEEVINGLSPFMQVITIGTTTCGKPYASTTYPLVPGLVNVNVLDSRSVNALGEGDFFEGLAPVCLAYDDPTLPYSDPRESLVSVALYYAENNRCPANEIAFSANRSIKKTANTTPVTDAVPASGAMIR